jgi:prevent-host-death family protein
MKEISYGVRELQAHLGEALRAAQRGDRVVITSHGRPIAVLGKAEPSRKAVSPTDRKLLRMAAEGKIILGNGRRIGPFKAPDLSGLARQALADRR